VRRVRLIPFVLAVLAVPLVVTTAHAATVSPHAVPTAAQLLAKVATCTQISRGMFATDGGEPATVPICGTPGSRTAPVWWTADMDVDCDGVRTVNCNESTDCCFQNDTTLHRSDGQPLQADLTHFFVIPQDSAAAWHYSRDSGIALGDVGAVIYQDRLVYAVFGDTGPTSIIGEASYATAAALAINPDPSNGGTDDPVTYIVFPHTRPDPVESNDAITAAGEAAASAFVGS
jgi:hypothetical protein